MLTIPIIFVGVLAALLFAGFKVLGAVLLATGRAPPPLLLGRQSRVHYRRYAMPCRGHRLREMAGYHLGHTKALARVAFAAVRAGLRWGAWAPRPCAWLRAKRKAVN